MKENKGITLVALIITIIVLLILAVVTISAVNEGSLFSYANNAAEGYSKAQEEENTMISNWLAEIAKHDPSNEKLSDESILELLNKAMNEDTEAQKKLEDMGFLENAMLFYDTDNMVYIYDGVWYFLDSNTHTVLILTEEVNSVTYARTQAFVTFFNTVKDKFLGKDVGTFSQTYDSNDYKWTIEGYDFSFDSEDAILETDHYIDGDTQKDVPIGLKIENPSIENNIISGTVVSVNLLH